MKTNFFTFCVDIGIYSKHDLQRCLRLLVGSIHKHIDNYNLICYTNFKLDDDILQKYNIHIKDYYDNTNTKMYNDENSDYSKDWLNLSFNKINIYRDLYNEYNENYIWIDLDTIVSADISYINRLSTCFIENGGDSQQKQVLFSNNDDIALMRKNYIQGNLWKLDNELYNELMLTLTEIKKQNLMLQFDLQDLFSYHIYIKNSGNLQNINILGNNVMHDTLNGLCIWSSSGNLHPNVDGLNNLYYDNKSLKTNLYPNREIHILGFTFHTLTELWNSNKFIEMFNFDTCINIGVFGTCRIDDYNIDNITQIRDSYPYVYRSPTHNIVVRPTGYTTTTSDVYQNLSLIKTEQYKLIKDSYIYHNVFLKHGGEQLMIDTDYKYIVLEICSIKKIIHVKSKLIFPYEVEGDYNEKDFEIKTESFYETIENIIKIRDLLKCKVILLPPITEFNGNNVMGVHENTVPDKVIEYRSDIITRLTAASTLDNIFFIDWNLFIKEKGVNIMIQDQFHFTEYGKKYISQKIYDFVRRKQIYYKNENILINIPYNNNTRHRYYQSFEKRDNAEVLFRLLIDYLYKNNILDKTQNIIDLGAWIGDNTIPWALKNDGIIYAIDPSHENINYINELSFLNCVSNVKTIQTCVSNQIETVYTDGDLKHTEFNIDSGNIQLQTTTLDQLLHQNIIKDINFIHLDVEGFELKVLEGSINLIKKYNPIICWEGHLTTDNIQGIHNFFTNNSYNTYMINEFFPHCLPDCRNFISIPNKHDLIDIEQINSYFNDNNYAIHKSNLNHKFLISLNFTNSNT